MVVIELANEELVVFTELAIVSTLPANDEEKVLAVLFAVVILEASEALFVFMLVCSPSTLVARLELLVVRVP